MEPRQPEGRAAEPPSLPRGRAWSRGRAVTTIAWVAFAAAGGLLWAAQFEPRAYVVAPWIALVPLLLLMGAPRPAWLGFVHGLVYWLASIPWIASTLETYGQLPRWLSWALLGLLAAYLGLFHAAFAGIGARLWRRGGWMALVGLPALWVVLELLRGWLISGFPWNIAAYAWVDVPGALPLSSWVGPWGISYLLVLANLGVAATVAWRRPRLGAIAVLVPLVLLPLAGRFAHGEARSGPPQPVRLLQPNIANLVSYEPLPALRNYGRVLAMSEQACDVPGALVVWPESAGWPFGYPADANFRDDLHRLVARGCPILFNTAFEESDKRWRNAAFLLAPDLREQRADKRHLVPFGEYVPAKAFFPFLDSLARNAGDFTAASELRLLEWGRERLAVAICFEVIFPGEVAEAVREGATVLVTITNDAWYGDTSAPWQHFRAVRFRAAEERRPLVRAAITGISALVRADGSVASQLGPFAEGVLRGNVIGSAGLSPYARLPWLGPVLAWILAIGALALARRRR
ncbi:MAG TPA: apolipoprotein N-acyltransferase [Thermoanaerobaculia bacterium]|nr:apolipoprotein N-acyltransferase [Thermoanaerobaculia bacterium]